MVAMEIPAGKPSVKHKFRSVLYENIRTECPRTFKRRTIDTPEDKVVFELVIVLSFRHIPAIDERVEDSTIPLRDAESLMPAGLHICLKNN